MHIQSLKVTLYFYKYVGITRLKQNTKSDRIIYIHTHTRVYVRRNKKKKSWKSDKEIKGNIR